MTGSELITVTTVGRCHKYTGIWHQAWRDGKERRKPKKNVSSERFTQQKQARYVFRPTLSGVVAFAQARASYGGATGLAWVSDGLAAGARKGIQVVPVVFRSGFLSSSVASLFPLVR